MKDTTKIILLLFTFMSIFLIVTHSVISIDYGTWTDLNDTDVNDWMGNGMQILDTIYYDNLVYVLTANPFSIIGVYNYTDNTLYNITNVTGYIGTAQILHMKIYNDIIYIVGSGGRFFSYNITSNTYYNLSSTDTGNWIGTSSILNLDIDKNNNLIYLVLQTGKYGYYNISDNITYTLNYTDIDNWIGVTTINSVAVDNRTNNVYIGIQSAQNGRLGVYNITSNTTINLTNTTLNNWTVSGFSALFYDYNNNLIYTGLTSTANSNLGVYNISSNIWYDLTDTSLNNWANGLQVNSLYYDSENNLLYTGSNNGRFGVYDPATNIWYDLSDTDNNNWAGTSSITSIDKNLNNNLIYTGLNIGFGVYNPLNISLCIDSCPELPLISGYGTADYTPVINIFVVLMIIGVVLGLIVLFWREMHERKN